MFCHPSIHSPINPPALPIFSKKLGNIGRYWVIVTGYWLFVIGAGYLLLLTGK